MKIIGLVFVALSALVLPAQQTSGTITIGPAFQLPDHDSSTFSVEKLTDAEIKSLHEAEEKQQKALSELNAVQESVKKAHGAYSGSSVHCNGNVCYDDLVCHYGSKQVEIRGDYALVTEYKYAQCH